jgi:hypothetical protein
VHVSELSLLEGEERHFNVIGHVDLLIYGGRKEVVKEI